MRTTQAQTESVGFVISRVFDAARALVWKAFTDPERMKQWCGPKGFTVTNSRMDLHPGGSYHYGLTGSDGTPMWGKFVFREIVPAKQMVVLSSFSDPSAGTTRHLMAPDWPLEMLSSFNFEEQPGEKTEITIRASPHNANEKERSTFDAGRDRMRIAWSGTFDQVAPYLQKT